MKQVAGNKSNVSILMSRSKGNKLYNKDNFFKVAKSFVCLFLLQGGQGGVGHNYSQTMKWLIFYTIYQKGLLPHSQLRA